MTRAVIVTEAGTIEADLFTEGAPLAAANFIKLAKAGFYDDVIFHRVIPGFMIQGGDGEFGKKSSLNTGRVGTGGPGYKFADEPFTGRLPARHPGDGERRPEHQRLAVLHLPRRATRLPKSYTIFGMVTKGLDVVDVIATAPRNSRDLPDNAGRDDRASRVLDGRIDPPRYVDEKIFTEGADKPLP